MMKVKRKAKQTIEEMEDLTDYHLALLIQPIEAHVRLLEAELAKHLSFRIGGRNNRSIEQEIAAKRTELKVLEMAMIAAPVYHPIEAQERKESDTLFAASLVDKIKGCKATIARLQIELGIAPEEWLKNKQLNTKAETAVWLQMTVTDMRIMQLALRGLGLENSHGQLVDTTA